MTMVYAKFGGQTKAVFARQQLSRFITFLKGNAKKENTKEVMHPLQCNGKFREN